MSSITTLARSDQRITRPLARAPRPVPTESARKPRRRRRSRQFSTGPAPRVMDMHLRSVALWPRSYR